MVHEAILWSADKNRRVVCALCAHRCVIAAGGWGVCGVRENREGRLITHAYGELIAANVDPIEKKPFYHFLPGTSSLSVAAAGCNFRCGFCQNWQISQLSAKDAISHGGGQAMTPAEIVRAARARHCRSVSYTYTEPTIFFEYALDTARLAKTAGLANTFVTNGFMTAEALEAVKPYLDAANVDLKSFRDETYKKVCKGRLQPVLDSIALMRTLGVWVEVTTLVVPGMNDGEDELRDIARFLAGVDRDMPWHLSRFHPDYEFTDRGATPVSLLQRAEGWGREAGLRYVYIGNVAAGEDITACPQCGAEIIRRRGFFVESDRIAGGRCPDCGTRIAGVF